MLIKLYALVSSVEFKSRWLVPSDHRLPNSKKDQKTTTKELKFVFIPSIAHQLIPKQHWMNKFLLYASILKYQWEFGTYGWINKDFKYSFKPLKITLSIRKEKHKVISNCWHWPASVHESLFMCVMAVKEVKLQAFVYLSGLIDPFHSHVIDTHEP